MSVRNFIHRICGQSIRFLFGQKAANETGESEAAPAPKVEVEVEADEPTYYVRLPVSDIFGIARKVEGKITNEMAADVWFYVSAKLKATPDLQDPDIKRVHDFAAVLFRTAQDFENGYLSRSTSHYIYVPFKDWPVLKDARNVFGISLQKYSGKEEKEAKDIGTEAAVGKYIKTYSSLYYFESKLADVIQKIEEDPKSYIVAVFGHSPEHPSPPGAHP